MKEEQSKIQNILNPKTKLKNPQNRRKQEKIRKLIIIKTLQEGPKNAPTK